MSEPVFAVVGHPNKGKSSVVSTLAHDDSVRIGADPGTTAHCRRYPMRIDGEPIYTLVDTPGFQRARRALEWLQERETTAAERAERVAEFVAVHRDTGAFPDECELLAPILEGAAIVYVVDGSRPYGPEYEAEMEILRWTGRPRLALVNRIADADHVAEWRAALRQYFQVVRVFDAMAASFEARIELLRAIGPLEESWTAALGRAVQSLEAERARQHRAAARAIAEMLCDMLTMTTTRRLEANDDPSRHHEKLERELCERLRARERRGRAAVEADYDHHGIDRSERDVELLDRDLFSMDDWYFWGLDRRQLVTAGTAGGALLGGAVDAGLGGASLLLGSLIGAAAGGATAFFGGRRLTRVKVLTLPLGGVLLQCGPTRHANFPYVVLGRALHHRATIAGRAHADRREVVLDEAQGHGSAIDRLSGDERRSLDASFRRLRDGAAAHEVSETLAGVLERLIAKE